MARRETVQRGVRQRDESVGAVCARACEYVCAFLCARMRACAHARDVRMRARMYVRVRMPARAHTHAHARAVGVHVHVHCMCMRARAHLGVRAHACVRVLRVVRERGHVYECADQCMFRCARTRA